MLLKRFKPKVIRLLPVLLLASLWVAASCNITAYEDGGGEKGGYYQTRILAVTVNPNPIASGDTTRITCVIEDSLNKSFIFVWQFGYGKALNVKDTIWRPKVDLKAYTSGHRSYINWVAPTNMTGYNEVGITVRADNHSDSIAVEDANAVIVN
ncbi:MAG TPA: hypothetical protein VKA08_11945 [Balneolales bacterium]|nr:hypothetical protein [Balneolales bacterium]